MSQIYKNSSGGGGSGIQTINGDVGSITGSNVTIYANNASLGSGSSVLFTNAGTVSTLSLTDSLFNTLIGFQAGKAGISGANNAALGRAALASLSTGSANLGIGTSALMSLTSANNNIGVGTASLQNLVNADSNIGIGSATLQNLASGSLNIAIGTVAGQSLTSNDSNNILIGNTGVSGDNNRIRIGASGIHSTAFVQGISGVTVAASAPVAVNTSGQLSSLGFGTSGQVLTSNGAGTSPSWQPTNLLVTAKITLTSTQIKNLAASPVTLIAAPGANKVIAPINFIFRFNYGGTNQFTGGSQMRVFLNATNDATYATAALLSTTIINGTQTSSELYDSLGTAAVAGATVTNKPLVVSVDSTDYAGNAANDNTIDVIVSYVLMDLS